LVSLIKTDDERNTKRRGRSRYMRAECVKKKQLLPNKTARGGNGRGRGTGAARKVSKGEGIGSETIKFVDEPERRVK